jgi:hypothetical protein
MLVLSKYKDYYDFLAFQYGLDKFPVYDRKDCYYLTQDQLLRWLCYDTNNYRDTEAHWFDNLWNKGEPEYFGIEIGYSWFLIEVKDIKRTKNKDWKDFTGNPVHDVVEYYDFSGDLKIVKTLENVKHRFEKPMTISYFDLEDLNWFRESSWWRGRAKKDFDWSVVTERDVTWKNHDRKAKDFGSYDGFENPILKDTRIPGIIPAETVYRLLDTYLSSQFNDKDQESEGLTDKEKAINKGFDSVESFRHPVKLRDIK